MTRSSNLEALCRLLVSSCIFNLHLCVLLPPEVAPVLQGLGQLVSIIHHWSCVLALKDLEEQHVAIWKCNLQWWWWCTWKSTWNPATWLCRWKWDSSGLVLDLTGMIIHSFEGNQWKSYQQNSDSHKKCSESAILKTENRRRLKSFPTRCPKAIRLSLTLQTEKCLLLLERGVAFLLLLQAPQEAYRTTSKVECHFCWSMNFCCSYSVEFLWESLNIFKHFKFFVPSNFWGIQFTRDIASCTAVPLLCRDWSSSALARLGDPSRRLDQPRFADKIAGWIVCVLYWWNTLPI